MIDRRLRRVCVFSGSRANYGRLVPQLPYLNGFELLTRGNSCPGVLCMTVDSTCVDSVCWAPCCLRSTGAHWNDDVSWRPNLPSRGPFASDSGMGLLSGSTHSTSLCVQLAGGRMLRGTTFRCGGLALKKARYLAPTHPCASCAGDCREVTPPQVYWDRFALNDSAQSQIGMKIGVADKVLSLRRCVAVYDRGLAMYWLQLTWTSQGTPLSALLIAVFLAICHQAAAALWKHLLSVDLVVEVHVPRMVHLRPLRHNGLWLRPLDVRLLLEHRQWFGGPALTLSIHDKQCIAEDAYLLEVGGSRAPCRRESDADPGLEVHISTRAVHWTESRLPARSGAAGLWSEIYEALNEGTRWRPQSAPSSAIRCDFLQSSVQRDKEIE